jgi:transposase
MTGRHAVVIMDGADCHQKHTTAGLDNVSNIELPPYSPELNKVEQVWQ